MGEAYEELRRQAGLDDNELPELAGRNGAGDETTTDGAAAAGRPDSRTEELP